MYFSVQISQEQDGHYRALCPELGLSTRDTDQTAAVDKLKTLILDWLSESVELYSANPESGYLMTNAAQSPGEYAILNADDGLKLLHIPRHKWVH